MADSVLQRNRRYTTQKEMITAECTRNITMAENQFKQQSAGSACAGRVHEPWVVLQALSGLRRWLRVYRSAFAICSFPDQLSPDAERLPASSQLVAYRFAILRPRDSFLRLRAGVTRRSWRLTSSRSSRVRRGASSEQMCKCVGGFEIERSGTAADRVWSTLPIFRG